MSTPRSIGLFLPGTPGFYSDVLLGAQEFGRGRWAAEVGRTLAVAEDLTREWQPDGALIAAVDGDWKPLVARLKGPVVMIGGASMPRLPRILSDDLAIGRMAATYFLGRGFRHHAFCGYDLGWSNRREAGWREVLKESRTPVEIYRSPGAGIGITDVTGKLAGWVRQLPKPVAIFCCHDRVAMFVGHACAYLGVKVPDQVAVLGVDNNLLECDFTRPAVSSIMGSARRLGYQAAELLQHLMDGGRPPAQPILVPPAGIEERASTNAFASSDPDVVAALRYIHANIEANLHVNDVAKAVLITRRMLERKFQAHLGCSPREQILQVQISRAKDLLIHTDHSALEVAVRSGFTSGSKLSDIFRREVQLTPTAFRRLYGDNPWTRAGAAR